jgi:hypothetical protein
MVMAQPRAVKTDVSLMHLWYKELMREFHDQLVSVRDGNWFLGLLSNTEFRGANMQVIEIIGVWPAAT